MQLFKQLSWYFIKEWKKYVSSIVLLIIVAILQLLTPKIVGITVDLIVSKKMHSEQALKWIILMFFISITIYILRYLWRVLLFSASYMLAVELRCKIYQYLSKKKMSFYLKNRTGDLIAKATNDVDRVVFAAGEGVLTLIDATVMGLLVLIIMSTQISFKLTLISIMPMPIMGFVIKKYGKKLQKLYTKSQAAFSSINDQVQESITCIKMIKSFGLEKRQLNKFNKTTKIASDQNIKVATVDAKFDPAIYICTSFSNLIAIIFGSYLVINKKLSIGQLTSFIMYLGLMIWPMLALAWMFNILERGIAAWNRIKNLIYKEKIDKKKKYIMMDGGLIYLKINNFYYKKKQKFNLKNISIKIPSENIIGICGPTGSGKTTIINIMQKQLKIKYGFIKYNNENISNINTDQWQKKLAIINQKTFLFSDTIFNNISLGKPNVSYLKIKKASKIARIHNEIKSFSKKYSTRIGEKGIILSGGQMQRIAIARAIVSNRKILIMDDALSSVDIKNEKKILNNLWKWKKKKKITIIIITHRLLSIKNANKIYVIKQGNIIQSGTHDFLMSNKNWYSNMYHYQELSKNNM
ncbi:ABC transporter transmembrane domain-containing protein [Buchnera aphidicola (Taiwanaphis decaspermi)]|uniref:ABC transporter transmembrane domain-containing protein n=1 Tax=Buchnera aphidicola TaxID=9 RepID=UPI0031B888CD